MGERADAEGAVTARAGAGATASSPGVDVHRSLFEHANAGLAFHEVVLDAEGRPIDYVFLEVNAAFEKQTGLRRESILGRRATEALPGIDRDPAGTDVSRSRGSRFSSSNSRPLSSAGTT
jgi:PAS domain-containing protein